MSAVMNILRNDRLGNKAGLCVHVKHGNTYDQLSTIEEAGRSAGYYGKGEFSGILIREMARINRSIELEPFVAEGASSDYGAGHFSNADHPVLTFDLTNDTVTVASWDATHKATMPMDSEGLELAHKRLEHFEKAMDLGWANSEHEAFGTGDQEFERIWDKRNNPSSDELPDAGVNGTGPIVVEQHTRTNASGKVSPVKKHTRKPSGS